MNEKSILIIDDDQDIRESLKQVLEWESYHVLTAENGQDALNLLKGMNEQSLPGLIILDLMMPVMGGLEFLNALVQSKLEHIIKIPVVLASAKGSLASLPEHPLIVERIKKPFDIDEFFKITEKYCCK
jgi:CheY-like chemotaxis protein